jgi:hypothetical protein
VSAAEVARLSNAELMTLAEQAAAQMATLAGVVALATGELERREGFRDEGATSVAAWLAERSALSPASARAMAAVGARLGDLPSLTAALVAGELSFDQVKTVIAVAEPETDATWRETATRCSVRELAELVRAERPVNRGMSAEEHRSLRCDDTGRRVSAQLGAAGYAEVKAALMARADEIPSDGETPLDARLADALVSLVHTQGNGSASSGFTVVAHVPLEVLRDDDSTLFGELDTAGLVDAEVVRRLACDATVVVALDDEAGHTMFEGRARRFPSATQRRELTRRDRHCRFPGCAHSAFVVPTT